MTLELAQGQGHLAAPLKSQDTDPKEAQAPLGFITKCRAGSVVLSL